MPTQTIEVPNPICVRGTGVIGTCMYERQAHNVIKSMRLKQWQKDVAVAVANQCSRTDHVTSDKHKAGKPCPRGGVYRLVTPDQAAEVLRENSLCVVKAIASAKSGARMPVVIPQARGLREYYRQ